MMLPTQPVTLTVEQITELNHQLSNMRHDINNQLSLILAATELIRAKPHMVDRMTATLVEQPPKVTAAVTRFSTEFEKTLGIKRD